MTDSEPNAKFLDHLRRPRHHGRLTPCDGLGRAGGEPCPDTITLTVRIRQDTIAEIAFETTGCDATVACGSAACELALGKGLDEAAEIEAGAILSAVGGLPPDQHHVAHMAAEALANALWAYVIGEIEKAAGGL